jgi:hypothetical protein
MSDADSWASNNYDSGCSLVELPSHPQHSQRIDYHLLNGRSDDKEDRIIQKPQLGLSLGWLESVSPDDLIS